MSCLLVLDDYVFIITVVDTFQIYLICFAMWVLRRIFGPKKDEVTREWRKLHKELNDLYCSPNIAQGNQDE